MIHAKRICRIATLEVNTVFGVEENQLLGGCTMFCFRNLKVGMILLVVVISVVFSVVTCAEEVSAERVTLHYTDYPEELLFGMMMYTNSYEETFQEMVDLMGLGTVRTSVAWDLTQPEQGGEIDFSITDTQVDVVREYGMEPVMLVCASPHWASGVGEAEAKLFNERGWGHLKGVLLPRMEYVDDFQKWIKAMAEHFKGRVHYYEFWNEPNGYGGPQLIYNDEGEPVDIQVGFDPDLYTHFLKIAYETIKQVDPAAQVSVGGLDPGSKRITFLQGIYDAGGKDYFDAVAIHPYGNDPLKWFENERQGQALYYDMVLDTRLLMKDQGDGHKAMWVTEFGYSGNWRDKETMALKADYVKRALEFFKDTPYITITHYHYFNGNSDDGWDIFQPGVVEAYAKTRWDRQDSADIVELLGFNPWE